MRHPFDCKQLRSAKSQLLPPVSIKKLKRQNTHTHKVAAVDTLLGPGNDRTPPPQ
nr:hypothetical protein [uncultured Desulfobacter sp.]